MPLQNAAQLVTFAGYIKLTKLDLEKEWGEGTPYVWVTGCKIGTKPASFFLIKPDAHALADLTAKTTNPTAKSVKGTCSSAPDKRLRLSDKALAHTLATHLKALDAALKDAVEIPPDAKPAEGEATAKPTPTTKPSTPVVSTPKLDAPSGGAKPVVQTPRPLPDTPPNPGTSPVKPTVTGTPTKQASPTKPTASGPVKASDPVKPPVTQPSPVKANAGTQPPKPTPKVTPSASKPTTPETPPPKAAPTKPTADVPVPTASAKPPTPKPKGPRVKVNTKEEFKGILEGADQLDAETAESFHNRLGEALGGLEEMKKHFDGIKAKGMKIKFDPAATDAYAVGKTIILPTKTTSGGKRDAADMIDALIFESCNVEVEEDYALLDKQFTEKRDMTLAEFGRKKAGIEATKVTLRAAQMSASMEGDGMDIAAQGKANIAAIKAVDPAFFGGGEMDASTKATKETALVDKMCATKHNKEIDPAVRPGDLAKPGWLKSGEVYHYEKTKSVGAVTLVGIIMKPVAAGLKDGVGKSEIQDWVRACAQKITEANRDTQPLMFCTVLETIKKKVPAVSFTGLEFSSDMRKCAVANGSGVFIAPLPKILQDK